LDISHPKSSEQSAAVYEVLSELGAENKPMITALNKIDKVESEECVDRLKRSIRNSVAISALKKVGMDELAAKIMAQLSGMIARVEVFIPHKNMDLLSVIHSEGRVIKEGYKPDGVYVEAEVPAGVKYLLERRGLVKKIHLSH